MFRVGVTDDLLKPDGTPGFGDIGLDLLDRAGIAWKFMPASGGEIALERADEFDGLLVLASRVSARTVGQPGRLFGIIGRLKDRGPGRG